MNSALYWIDSVERMGSANDLGRLPSPGATYANLRLVVAYCSLLDKEGHILHVDLFLIPS